MDANARSSQKVAPMYDQQRVATDNRIDDDGNGSDDDDSSIGVPLVSVAPGAALTATTSTKEKVERPPDGLRWDDAAILDCWSHAVEGHDDAEPAGWSAPSLIHQEDLEVLTNWKPKSLSIPLWAVDPFFAPTRTDGT